MSYQNTAPRALDRTGTHGQAGLRGFAALRARISLALQCRRIEEQTHRELSSLSDRDLADLGIARCDIERIARDAAELHTGATPRP